MGVQLSVGPKAACVRLMAVLGATCILLESVGRVNAAALPDGHSSTTCDTSACLATAAELLSYIDFGVDPCNDMDAFVCSKWRNDYPLRDDQAEISVAKKVQV